jgi:Right handed beta helix region
MKKKMSLILAITACWITISCNQGRKPAINENGRILKVPSEFSTIELAVKNSVDGDWIILAPGRYMEMKIDLDKSVTISSEWKITGDKLKIEETEINPQDSILFNIRADSVEISGLKIINGDHPLNIMARVIIKNNHFVNNLDAISCEGSGGGYVGYNTIENDRDDGIDLDIRYGEENRGSDILVENNTIVNSHDDGMEIRLYDYPDQNINYEIRNNKISGSNNAGIQIISYDIFTGKKFKIHHNIISGCKTGLGCMEGANTREDMTGASKMDELVIFFNNNLINNQTGATGGNNIIAINNLLHGNTAGGFKRFGPGSAIINNLFFLNGDDDLLEINKAAVRSGNIFATDPLIDLATFEPSANSPCIDAGLGKYELNGTVTLEVPEDYISGSSPDIGAIERK